MTTKVADPNQWTLSLGGVPISGYANGEFLTIAYLNPAVEDEVGTSGEVSVSPSADLRADIQFKLMQTSDSNDYLSGVANLQRRVKGVGMLALLIKDRNGRSVYQAANCWIREEPQVSLDRTPKERVWTFRCDALIRFDGGN